MAGVNKVIIVGNLGADPELKTLESGASVCRLSVATTRVWNNKTTNEKQQETEWHRITVWGKQAEHCEKYLAKGRQVYVEGRLRTSSYEKEGQKHYSTEIVADQVQFLGGRDGGGQGGGSGDGGGDQSGGNGGQRGGGYQQPTDPDDDIPF